MQYECRHPVKRIRMSAHALPRVKTNQLGRNAASRILNDENRQRPVRSRASVGECSSGGLYIITLFKRHVFQCLS